MVAVLVAKYLEAGGLYLWTRRDFGAWAGFLSFWVYWMGIAFLFSTAALLYIKAGFSMFSPLVARLGDNRFNLLSLLTGCGLLLFVESASFFCSVDLLVSS
jgi:amino acid transporter